MANEIEVLANELKFTKEEVKEMIKNKSEENLEKVIINYHFYLKNVVSKICRKYNNLNLYDDFMQEAEIPLIKTYWDYDESKHADFTTILKIRIEGYIQQMYNDNYRTVAVPKHAFKDKKIQSMSILMNDFIDIDTYAENGNTLDISYDICVDNTNEIHKIFKTFLSDKQFFILYHCKGFDMQKPKTTTEVGQYFNCTRQPIERELKKIEQLIAENKNKFTGVIGND